MNQLNKLPHLAYKDNDGSFGVEPKYRFVCVQRAKAGFVGVENDTHKDAASLNNLMGSTPQQVGAMFYAARMGFDSDGADPELYTSEGKLLLLPYGDDTIMLLHVKSRLAELARQFRYGQPEEDADLSVIAEYQEFEQLQGVKHELDWCWSDDYKVLISTNHFTDYIREGLRETGDIMRNGFVDSSPHIDWDKVTEAAEQDYKMFPLGGFDYWVRN